MLKLLIVEDEDIIRKGLAYTIDWMSLGYIVAGEASNGEEGLEMILQLKPDVVLADIMMPKLNGIEMIRKAREEVQFQSILLTSYAEFDYARQAIELRTFEYLMKPVAVDELTKVMVKLKEVITENREKELLLTQKKSGIDTEKFMTAKSYQNAYVQKTVHHIIKHYHEKISIEEISERLGVSASYLSRKFKEDTGHTYLDFLNMYRVQQAVQLLDEGIYRVYQISDLTGFTDYKHFCAVFKRYTNTSPTEFIKQKEKC